MTRHERHHFERGIVAWHVAVRHDCADETVAVAAKLSGRRRGSKAFRAFMLGYLRARRCAVTPGGYIPTPREVLAA